MKPMIWKELRENIQWAVLSAAVLGMAYFFELTQWTSVTNGSWSITELAYPVSSAIFTPLVALLMGLVQIVPELRRDQWAFLVHRPVSRTGLFWGKAIPGLVLYLLATSIPLLGAAWWIQRHFPSFYGFDWRGLQGAFADILAGMVFYFAAILVALRPVRWYGSRMLPVFAAILYEIFLFSIPVFGWALFATGVFLGLFILAARGNFVNFGEYRGQGWLSKFGFGTILLSGLLLLGGGGVAMLSGYVAGLFRNSTQDLEEPTVRLNEARYRVDSNGELVRIGALYMSSFYYPEGWTAKREDIKHVDGRPWLGGRRSIGKSGSIYNAYQSDFLQPQTYLQRFGGGYGGWPASYRSWSSRFTFLLAPQGKGVSSILNSAFYSDSERRVLFFSREKNAIVGYMGPGGYYEPGAEPARGARFSSRLLKADEDNVMRFSDGIYRIEPEKHRVTLIVANKPGRAIYDADLVKIDVSGQRFVFVLSEAGIEAYSLDGRLLFTVPLTLAQLEFPLVRVYVPRSGDHMLLWLTAAMSAYSEYDTSSPSHFVKISPQGKILQQQALPALPIAPPPPLKAREWLPGIYVGLTAPTNAASVLNKLTGLPVSGILPALTGQRGRPELTRLILALGALASLSSAFAMLLLAKRCSFSRGEKWTWLTVALLFGPSGLLLAIAMLPWPARVKCPKCSKPRDVHHELCAHCGAPFPPPVPDGTEIFA